MRFLVTGGGGFIGSHLTEKLVNLKAAKVIVADNLSSGSLDNLKQLSKRKNLKVVIGDLNDFKLCDKLCSQVDFVFHLAAMGSVPRSIEFPLLTHQNNSTVFLNVLEAARRNKIRRLIYSSSSSVYGDSKKLPKVEDVIGLPLSPYAVSKYTNELYAGVFAKMFSMDIIGLRYFNVFGPRQSPVGPYAAVIPQFLNKMLNNEKIIIYGDGRQRRDFTYVENVVQANLRALEAPAMRFAGEVFNVGCGEVTTLNSLFTIIAEKTGYKKKPHYAKERSGDIKNSYADIGKSRRNLKYKPLFNIREGLDKTVEWYRSNA